MLDVFAGELMPELLENMLLTLNLDQIKDYLKKNKQVFNFRDALGNNALHLVLQRDLPIESQKGKQLKVAKWLIEKGIDITAKNKMGLNILHYIAQNDLYEIYDYLYSRSPKEIKAIANVCAIYTEEVPTIIAAKENNEEMLKRLCKIRPVTATEYEKLAKAHRLNDRCHQYILGVEPEKIQENCDWFEATLSLIDEEEDDIDENLLAMIEALRASEPQTASSSQPDPKITNPFDLDLFKIPDETPSNVRGRANGFAFDPSQISMPEPVQRDEKSMQGTSARNEVKGFAFDPSQISLPSFTVDEPNRDNRPGLVGSAAEVIDFSLAQDKGYLPSFTSKGFEVWKHPYFAQSPELYDAVKEMQKRSLNEHQAQEHSIDNTPEDYYEGRRNYY